MPDTLDQIAHELLLHCELAGKPLAQLWAQNALRSVHGSRDLWSWCLRHGELLVPDSYSTGTVTITSADPTLLIGSGTTFTSLMVGRHVFLSSHSIEIAEFIDTTHLRLKQPWGEADISTGVGYYIAQRYFTMPDDFLFFLSVSDPTQNCRLHVGTEKRKLDRNDPRRTTTGNPYCLAEAGYSDDFSGSVDTTPFHVRGTGPSPVFSGAYTAGIDSLFIIEITTAGDSGTAVYKWRRDTESTAGTYVTGVTTQAAGFELSDGVAVAFPAGTSYDLGDVFVSRATAKSGFGTVRFELWPVQLSKRSLPYYYVMQLPELVPSLALPRGIDRATVLKGALSEYCMWKGRDASTPNPMFDLKAAQLHKNEFEEEINKLALTDDNIYTKDVTYFQDLPFASPPWDASWEQRHA